jgi:hypothetical protein
MRVTPDGAGCPLLERRLVIMMKYRILGSEDIGQLNSAVELYLRHGWSLSGGVSCCRGSESGGSIGGFGGSVFNIWHAQAVTAPVDALDPLDAAAVKAAGEDARKAGLRAKLNEFHAQRA